MNLQTLSRDYMVRPLTPEDLELIYALSLGNPLFFQHCPPAVTRESILEDMVILPTRCSPADKFYLGFFRENQLVAILDLILRYPKETTAFVGLFMVDQALQGRGVGSAIIRDLTQYLKSLGFATVRLAYAKGNPRSEAFWRKNGFLPTGLEVPNETYTAVVMEKSLA